MTIYENYNEKRRQELIPFYNNIYFKNKNKAEGILEKRNEARDFPPNLEGKEIYVERNRPRKTDPLFSKVTVTNQEKSKVTGITQKQRPATAHVRAIKKLRKNGCVLQDTSDDTSPDDPGPSGHTSA